MVMPFCYDNVNDMFEATPWNFSSFAVDCQKKWGVFPRPAMANLVYGERALSAASNIVFR